MPSFISSVLLLALAASGFAAPAAPARRFSSIQPPHAAPKFFNCSAPNPTLPAGLAVTAGLTTKFVGLGVGTQNYTCGAAGTYTSIGAVATLYDVSCLVGTPLFTSLPGIAFDISQRAAANSAIAKQLGGGPHPLGVHIFQNAPTLSPVFDFTQSQGSSDFVVASKAASIASPQNSTLDVTWLQLTGNTGTLAKEVFRLYTSHGQPPATCTPGSANITVPYAAVYYFLD